MRKTTLLLCTLSALAAGCAVLGDDDTGTSEDDIQETDGLFGDDRVADALKGKLDKVPSSYAQAEKLFGVGRACARTDSKEVYVVEEAQTRMNGTATHTKDLLPRSVITGCNTPEHKMKETDDAESGSFSLFIALFSDPDGANAAKGDAMVMDRVETMALDRRTGLYNFYVFSPGPKADGPGIMQRIRLMPNNDVVVYTMAPGDRSVRQQKSADRECNNCHVNMGPLMNELREPWTNWVSTRKTLPAEASGLSGETFSIVNEAASIDRKHDRSSFANALEKTMTAGIRVWVEGLNAVPKSGFARANIDGDQPQGVKGMLKSVFCETELQYRSAFENINPLELFVDPIAVEGAQIIDPSAQRGWDLFPILMPVRSEMDKRIEFGLLKADVGGKRLLTKQTQLAVRLFDDANDVFSTKRCALYPKVLEKFPTDLSTVDAHVRTVLNKEIQGIPEGSRRDYAKALITEGGDVGAARTKYFEEARAKVASDVQKLGTEEGRTELKKRSQARKDAAEKMFKGNKVPLPLLSPEKF